LHYTAVFFFCGFVLPLGAAPKKGAEEIMIVPPKAEPSFARVFLDVPQAVTLHLSGRVNEPVEFFIRKKPRHGRLGEIRRTGPKSAIVDYTPNPGITPGSDSFTFAAKSMDSPVSAQARIDIQLLRRPAELEFKRQLDFGDAYLGDITAAHLIFRNHGGEAATVSLHAEEPWHIDTSNEVTVPGGGELSVEVFFEPKSLGKFQGRFVVKSSVQDVDLPSISLTGFARESIAHPAQGLTITSAMRAALPASIPFTNHSDRERSLDFEWPASIDAPSSVSIHILDRGVGIDRRDARRVFERFFRAEAVSNLPGSGLGLAITEQIIRLHRGSVRLRSRRGVGTVVAILLPMGR
jgi:hypothetical protein